jgi:glucosamine--fructose-6-phosphate aminotransferase (isomerizing)
MEGLKRLEYRGYDSAGIVTLSNGSVNLVKQAGKISNLEALLADHPIHGSVGIAHTRWATHGVPNAENAHPHTDCRNKIALIHNGIIENYGVIKTELISKGHQFRTQTDTEALVHLIEEFYKSGLSFEDAVRAALSQVEGTYGIAAICSDEPEMIVAARKGSPLVVGIGDGENFVASDVSAIINHTKQVSHLDDGEMVVVRRNGIAVTTIGNQPVQKQVEQIAFDLERIEKGGYDHFMLKEIMEQPQTIKDAMRGRLLID